MVNVVQNRRQGDIADMVSAGIPPHQAAISGGWSDASLIEERFSLTWAVADQKNSNDSGPTKL